jgi:hypothetical protein
MKICLWPEIGVRILVCGFVFVAAACSTAGDRNGAKSDVSKAITKDAPARAAINNELAAARTFVDDFYAWYTPIANGSNGAPAWYTVLDQRPRVLSDALLRALRRDRDEQAKAVGEIAGLDFDPFLASQDPCTRYVAGDSVQSGRTYRVSVFGVCGGKRHPQPDLVAEVARRDSSWVFVDFHYPGADGGHLLGILSSSDSSSTKQ